MKGFTQSFWSAVQERAIQIHEFAGSRRIFAVEFSNATIARECAEHGTDKGIFHDAPDCRLIANGTVVHFIWATEQPSN